MSIEFCRIRLQSDYKNQQKKELRRDGGQIDFYELNDNKWILDESLSCDGFVGSNSVTSNKHEGGYASPRGLYPVSDAFY